MKIGMIGVGYVGLVSGACLQTLVTMLYVLIRTKKIDGLRMGKMPIFEPGLKSLVEHNVSSKRLSFETSVVTLFLN